MSVVNPFFYCSCIILYFEKLDFFYFHEQQVMIIKIKTENLEMFYFL